MPASTYDAVAAWYDEWASWPTGLLDFARGLLPKDLTDRRVLDVACGSGRLSRGLQGAGAHVVGVDVSLEQIRKARSLTGTTGSVVAANPIDYHHADIADVEAWWDGSPFDAAACEMALMDIADLDAAVQAISTVLRPGAPFAATVVHPCFPGNAGGLSSWPPDRGYSVEGFWTSADHNPDGIRLHVGSYHRTLSTYLNTFIDAGFTIERLVEADATVPLVLAVGCRRRR